MLNLCWFRRGLFRTTTAIQLHIHLFEKKKSSKSLNVMKSTTNESYLLIVDLYIKHVQTQVITLDAVKQFVSIRTVVIDLLGAWPNNE
jgi:hypothetical protein